MSQGQKADINPQSPLVQDLEVFGTSNKRAEQSSRDWILSFTYPCPSRTAYPLTLEQWGLLAQPSSQRFGVLKDEGGTTGPVPGMSLLSWL